MHRPWPSSLMEWIGPVVGGLVFIAVMGRVRDPARRRFNAVLVGGAMGAYISGGLGLWELPFAALGSLVAYRALESTKMIGVAWLMHSAWDLVHHAYGDPIWPFMETSSFGCFVFDTVIGAWFLLGAPTSRAPNPTALEA